MSLHPTAIIDASAALGKANVIGPYCIVGPGVVLGDHNHLGSHVVLEKNVQMGSHNYVGSFASLGGSSQSMHDQHDDETHVIIGDHNRFYEYCTVNRGSKLDKKVTTIGDHNHLMTCAHVAHDCIVHDHVVLVNHATLGGHVEVFSHAILGAFVAVRQFCKVGSFAFLVEACQIIKDVLPYTVIVGSDCRIRGINKEGLKRHNFTEAQIRLLSEASRIVYRRGLTVPEALAALKVLESDDQDNLIAPFSRFLENSARGIVR
jgi:UDP-N-acetylglucosamine acyltransferase